jgi:hypothetical protein
MLMSISTREQKRNPIEFCRKLRDDNYQRRRLVHITPVELPFIPYWKNRILSLFSTNVKD